MYFYCCCCCKRGKTHTTANKIDEKNRVWNDSHDNLFDLLFELDCLFLLVFLFRKPFALSFFGLVWRGVYTFFPSSVLVLFYTCIRIAVDIHTKIFYNEALTTILVYKFNSTKSFICCCCFLRSRRVSVALFTFFFAVSGCILAASVNSTLAVLLFRCSHTKKNNPRAITYGCLALALCLRYDP